MVCIITTNPKTVQYLAHKYFAHVYCLVISRCFSQPSGSKSYINRLRQRGMDWSGSWKGEAGGCCVRGNELWCFINCCVFFFVTSWETISLSGIILMYIVFVQVVAYLALSSLSAASDSSTRSKSAMAPKVLPRFHLTSTYIWDTQFTEFSCEHFVFFQTAP